MSDQTEIIEQTEENPQDVVDTSSISLEDFKEKTGFDSVDDLMSDVTELKSRLENPAPVTHQDPFIQSIIDAHKRGENVGDFVKKATTDYNSMAPDVVAKMRLGSQLGVKGEKLDEMFDIMYKRGENYSEEETRQMEIQMLKDANDYRKVLIENQNSEKNETPKEEVLDEEQFRQLVNSQNETSSLLEGKKVSLNIGDNEFGFEVDDPQAIVDQAVNGEKFFEQFTKDNKIDYNKFYLVAAFAQNPEGFVNAVLTQGKSIGTENILDVIKNPSSPNGSPSEVTNEEGIAGLAKALLAAKNKQ